MNLHGKRRGAIQVGISSCLMGMSVRYDGGHRLNEAIINDMGSLFEFVPFCPEVAIGLGVPRPTIQLVNVKDKIHVRGVENPNNDVTGAITDYAATVTPQLRHMSGYIFKRGSPSCGIRDVVVYDCDTGEGIRTSPGMFAHLIMQALPELPVEDESRLSDANQREGFIMRVLAYHQDRHD